MQPICCICHDFFKATDVPSLIRCGHLFHPECLERWLLQKKTCPQCRASARAKPSKVFFNVSESSYDPELSDKLAAYEANINSLTEELELERTKAASALKRVAELEGKAENSIVMKIVIQNDGTIPRTSRIFVTNDQGGSK